MAAKATPLAFQPAPIPQPRVSPEQRAELAEATRDLSFARTTSSPVVESEPEAPSVASKTSLAPPPAIRDVTKSKTSTEAAAKTGGAKAAAARNAVLKFDIPEELWVSLRHEVVNRRATVKYLIPEAMSEKGYQVHLATIPEDGRRQR